MDGSPNSNSIEEEEKEKDGTARVKYVQAKKVIKSGYTTTTLTTLMSLDQKEIPKRLSSDHIDFVVKMMLEKSPLFRVLNMSLYSLDVSNGYFTKDG